MSTTPTTTSVTETPTELPPTGPARRSGGGKAASAWRMIRSDRGLFGGLVVLILLILAALVGPLILGKDPLATSTDVLSSPSAEHLFGTDSVGRDLFARVLYGLRFSLQVVALATAGTALLGITAGLFSGYLGGKADWTAMRLTEILLAIPGLMIAIAALASFGTSMTVLVIVLIVTFVSLALRVARAAAMQLRGRDYVLAAQLSEVGHSRILWTHILPNSRATLIVQITLTAAIVLLLETALSFLGLGAQPPTPALGAMINDGRVWMEIAPHVILVPTIFVVVLISAVTAVGNGLDRVLAKQTQR